VSGEVSKDLLLKTGFEFHLEHKVVVLEVVFPLEVTE
jgi:hypothetical protein